MTATVECPECRTVVDGADTICAYCGARLPREAIVLPQRPCPRCRKELVATLVGDTPVERCAGCGGMWLSGDALSALVANRQAQRRVVEAPVAPGSDGERPVRPALCPTCRALLQLVNFAPGSTIALDRCAAHGLWFDRDELRQAAEFVLGGGLDAAREAARADRELELAAGESPTVIPPIEPDPDLRPGALLPRGRGFFTALGKLFNVPEDD